MRFRGGLVWVMVDGQGRPVADGTGRAEMKYRIEDPKSYKPGLANLEPPGAGQSETRQDAPGARAAAPRPAARVTTDHAAGAPSDALHVWTDGACSGNPGPMGIGAVVLGEGARRELGEYLGEGTNNIAELVAIERGLALAAELDPKGTRPVRVYSDSGYAIGLLSKGWKAKANQDLVARLRRVTAKIADLTFVKVAGHAGVPENERCDELARLAVERRGTV